MELVPVGGVARRESCLADWPKGQQHRLSSALEVDRTRHVASVVHSAAMEGLHVTTATRTELGRFPDGEFEVEELVRRTRAQYGLK